MCVIAFGLRRDFREQHFISCCDHNPDGFFVALPDSDRFLRTMNKEEALNFFRTANPNEKVLLHARIKSKGEVTLANVHGWESDGLRFCHNGTLSITARGKMTDSETFFRDILIPAYRASGRVFGTTVQRVINAIIGPSKFAVIKGTEVLLFGEYHNVENVLYSNTFWNCSKTPYYGYNQPPTAWTKPKANKLTQSQTYYHQPQRKTIESFYPNPISEALSDKTSTMVDVEKATLKVLKKGKPNDPIPLANPNRQKDNGGPNS